MSTQLINSQVWASLGKSRQVRASSGIQESPGKSRHTGKSGQFRAYRRVLASPGIQECPGNSGHAGMFGQVWAYRKVWESLGIQESPDKSGHTGKSGQVRAYRKVRANLSKLEQYWANLNDTDDENDDDDKTMIETGKSDASLAYMALFFPFSSRTVQYSTVQYSK